MPYQRLALLIGTCLLLAGCLFYPTTTHSVDASELSSPYRGIYVHIDDGFLSLDIDDSVIKKTDLRRTKLEEFILITASGKEIHLNSVSTDFGTGLIYRVNLKGIDFDDNNFGLRVTTSLDGKKRTITGKFTVHSHFHVINVLNEM